MESFVQGLEARKVVCLDGLGQTLANSGTRADGGLEGRLVVRRDSPCTQA
jgi:hypothetical protein